MSYGTSVSQQHELMGEEFSDADTSGVYRRLNGEVRRKGDEPPRQPPGEPPRTGSIASRIAVIDDEVMITKVVARCLQSSFQVLTHNSGETALGWLSDLARTSMAPDLVLCDLCLGVVSGVDLFHDIARELPWLAPRVVFLTGGSCSSRDDAFLAAREASTLRKPFRPDELRDWVRRRVDPLMR